MFCVECGKEYSEQVKFCSNCGANLTQYHEKDSNLNHSGFSKVNQSLANKNPIIDPVISKENSVMNNQTRIDHTDNETESTTPNPENSWQDEKENMKSVISQLEYENRILWEENEKLTKPPTRNKNPKKSGLPRPQIKSSESMWSKFKKWYNE